MVRNSTRSNKTKNRSSQEYLETPSNYGILVQFEARPREKINKFSKESQELIADLNNTEIFELCENSSKQQCSDCNALRANFEIYAESNGVRPEQP